MYIMCHLWSKNRENRTYIYVYLGILKDLLKRYIKIQEQ